MRPLILFGLFSLALFSSGTAQTPSASPQVFAPKPKYLREWAAKGITGAGVAVLTVDRDGYVTEAHMLKSTGHKELDDSALDAFRRWHFKPGTVSPVRVPIDFKGFRTNR